MPISEKSQEFYRKLYARRRGWSVIKPTGKQQVTPYSEATLSKALALSELEIPVGDWIADELAKNPDMPKQLVELLQANIEDEVKHDEVLNNIRAVFPVKNEDIDQAQAFVVEANRLAELYSPVTLAGALESSIFFVALPMYRFLGSPAMRTVSRDISQDEIVHSAVNNQLKEDLGYRRGKKVNDLRQDIMDWLVSDLPNQHENKYLSANFWQSSSKNLYSTGKTESLKDTRRSVYTAFFETSGSDLPIYS